MTEYAFSLIGCTIITNKNLQIWTFFYVKFGLSEKHTKFEKNLPHGFDKSADLLSKRQNHEEDFFSNYVCFSKSLNFNNILH